MKFEEKILETKTADASVVRVTTSELLFSGARELVIKHVGEDYRLRLTNQGKLILTK
jgi:hemin uptake protein HemP